MFSRFFAKDRFRIERFNTKSICMVAMLITVTAVLSIYGTFRIGETIKIPTKFCSVFVSSALFGPWIGALVGATGDILNVFLAPTAPWIPLLTLGEFLCGFLYGLFFYNLPTDGPRFPVRALFCGVVLFVVDMFYTTFVLESAGYFPSFWVAFVFRLGAGIIKFTLQTGYFLLIGRFIPLFKKAIK